MSDLTDIDTVYSQLSLEIEQMKEVYEFEFYSLRNIDNLLAMAINDLQTEVDRISAFVERRIPGVSVGKGVTAGRVPARGISRVARAPTMRPEAMVKMGARMGARAALKELGVSAPLIGVIVALTFQIYESAMIEIANRAVMEALKKHELEEREKNKELYGDTIKRLEEVREAYRSIVP